MNTDQIGDGGVLPLRAEQAQPDIAAVPTKVTVLEQQARALIRQQPVVAVLGAVVAGYLAARLVSRARR